MAAGSAPNPNRGEYRRISDQNGRAYGVLLSCAEKVFGVRGAAKVEALLTAYGWIDKSDPKVYQGFYEFSDDELKEKEDQPDQRE